MAITIKKSKLTLKAPVAEAPATPEEGATAAPAAEAAEQPAGPPAKTGPGAFQVITLILVLLSFGIFSTLVLLQYLEWSYYHQPPTAFPEFVPNFNVLPSVSTAPKSAVPEALPEVLTPAPVATPAPAPTAAAAPAASNATSTTTAKPPPKTRPTRPPRPADMPDGV